MRFCRKIEKTLVATRRRRKTTKILSQEEASRTNLTRRTMTMRLILKNIQRFLLFSSR